MDWRNIPSLSALRAFEAAARLKNQSVAALELNVTHAAINQHIRALEAFFQTKLFERSGRQVALTKDGETLYAHVQKGFAEIASGVEALQDPIAAARLRVSLTPSLYTRWLLPRIERFWQLHPEVHLEIDSRSQLVDLELDRFDLALRFGNGDWPPYQSELFLSGNYAIFAAKSYLEAHPVSAENIGEAKWLRSLDSPEFNELHQQLGLDFSRDSDNLSFAHHPEARSAMVAGLGVLAEKRLFFVNELRFGLVQEIAPVDLPEDVGYYFVTKAGKPHPDLYKFMDWLREEAAMGDRPES